jgi:hypothetical protein
MQVNRHLLNLLAPLALLVQPVAMAERLMPSDLTYMGAFRVPATIAYEGMAAIDSTSSLSFRPDGDPSGPADGFTGSLFLSKSGYVSEITIPAPIKTSSATSLTVASQLQSVNGISGSAAWGTNDRFGGVAYMPAKGSQTSAKLYWSSFEYYNVDGTDYASVGWSDVNLSSPNGVGQWHVGPAAANWDSPYHGQKHGEYLIPVDQAWADQYTGGKSLLVGRYREAGAAGGSMGPVLTAIAPWQSGNPPSAGTNLAAVSLMAFNSISNHGGDTSWMEFRINNDPDYQYYSAGDHWHGGAWVARGTKKAILIVGRHGTYDGDPMCPKTNYGDGCGGGINTNTPPYCYGGTADCPGIAVTNNKGYHTGPYKPRFLFIDPDELAQVAQGTRAPNSIDAYNMYDPTNDWPWKDSDNMHDVAGAAYDSNGGYLYVAQANGYRPGGGSSAPWPIIHVYKVNGAPTIVPNAPSGINIR